MRISLIFAATLLFLQSSFAGFFLQGQAVNHLGVPLSGATVSTAQATAVTDAQGQFTLSSSPLSLIPSRSGSNRMNMALVKNHLVITNGHALVSLFSISGKMIRSEELGSDGYLQKPSMDLSRLADGAYVLRIYAGKSRYAFPLLAVRDYMSGKINLRLNSTVPQSSMKKTTAQSLTASATGYQNRSLSVPSDTSLDLMITLFPDGYAVPSTVTAAESTETMNFMIPFSFAQCDTDALNWAGKSWLKYFTPFVRGAGSIQSKSYKVIHLDNQYVRVDVSPDLGMRVIRVIDKTHGSPRSLFMPWGQTWEYNQGLHMNSGGLKASFPFFEHGLGIIDENGKFDEQSGYYIEHDIDGRVRLIMNLRFDHRQDERNATGLGHYCDRTLTEVVALRPGHTDFSIRFIVNNANPTRRCKTIWNCAMFPRETQQAWGGQWIFPARWAIDHQAAAIYDIGQNGVTGSYAWAYFGLYIQYPFVGAYYSGADASHLRITDPLQNPGAKVVDMDIWKELWGSTTVLFERPDGWINPFETRDLEYKYYMARGLGAKVAFANEYVAIATKPGNQFAMVSTTPSRVTVYEYNATTSPKMTNQSIGPLTVVTGSYTTGLRVVSEGKEVCNVQFPLPLVDNSNIYPTIKRETFQALVSDAGMDSLDASHGEYYEMETIPAKGNGLSILAVMRAAEKVTAADNPDVLISMANAAYQIGQFGICDQLLTKVNGRKPEQEKYLKALMALERGKPASFDNTPIEGNYLGALQDVKAGNTGAAIVKLDALLAQRPNAISPLLLRAYLKKDLTDAMTVMRLDPGLIELWTVLNELNYPGAAATLTSLLKQNQMATVRRDAFLQEIKQGAWKHNRRFEYQASWFEKVNLPAFPDSLKYIVQ
jgi:hypothetical protein